MTRPTFDTPVHSDDSYGRLARLCERENYVLGVARTGAKYELRVRGKGVSQITAPFRGGHENGAASYLLGKLRTRA